MGLSAGEKPLTRAQPRLKRLAVFRKLEILAGHKTRGQKTKKKNKTKKKKKKKRTLYKRVPVERRLPFEGLVMRQKRGHEVPWAHISREKGSPASLPQKDSGTSEKEKRKK